MSIIHCILCNRPCNPEGTYTIDVWQNMNWGFKAQLCPPCSGPPTPYPSTLQEWKLGLEAKLKLEDRVAAAVEAAVLARAQARSEPVRTTGFNDTESQ